MKRITQCLQIALLMFGGAFLSTAFANDNNSPTHQSAPSQVSTTSIQPSEAFPKNSLPASIREKMSQISLLDNQISIWVKPVNGQMPIIDFNSEVLRTPASTQKLVTTAIALDKLGSQYHWFTYIYQKGLVVNQTLYGDIIIKAQGDPSMTHERLKAMLGYLPKKGIRHINGNIIIDNSAFSGVAIDSNAFDGHGARAYNAQPNAFLVNFGTLEIDMLPSGQTFNTGQLDKFGKPVLGFMPTDNSQIAVQVLPPLSDFKFPKTLPAQGGACDSEPNFRLTSSELLPTGQAKTTCGRMTQWINFGDGDVFAVKAVKGMWQKYDPNFTGKVYTVSSPQTLVGLPIISYPSQNLASQIYQINQFSNNVMTEQVALSLPLTVNEKISTYPKTFGYINNWWQQHLKSPPPIMSRASGLCRDCQISVYAMGELLDYMYRQPEFEIFKASLPIAGQTGTMAKLAKRNHLNPAIGRAFIKTGTLDDVTSMAGYVLDTKGNMYVVVGMINAPSASGRAVGVLDEMLAVVASF